LIISRAEIRLGHFSDLLKQEKQRAGVSESVTVEEWKNQVSRSLQSLTRYNRPLAARRNLKDLIELEEAQAPLALVRRVSNSLFDFEEAPELMTLEEFKECTACVKAIAEDMGPVVRSLSFHPLVLTELRLTST